MPLLTCPSCGKPATSTARKLFLDSLRTFPCRSCGVPVRVSPLFGAACGAASLFLMSLIWLGVGRPLRFAILVPVLFGLGWFQVHRLPIVPADAPGLLSP
jgi:hypothetical protein